ncbi:MAG TPA: DUF1684 domain-containing protein [Streptosporangiaceae bacterium]|nr:DUF1684 domain-containing protein [Streptosporangiaceae bacterium]
MTVQEVDKLSFLQDWAQWHAEHEAALADEHGWLAITSVNWLTTEAQRFADAPGAWLTGDDGVLVVLDRGEDLRVDAQPVYDQHAFDPIPERGGVNVESGNAVIEVAKRCGHYIVRPRHPESPLRLNFAGIPVYQPSQDWVLTGRYLPFDQPRPTTVGSVVEGLHHVYDCPGQVEFEFEGQKLALTAFNGKSPGTYNLLFTDRTSGVTTYAANRSLQVAAPEADGLVTLDFNRAVNLPCAFTDFATCPLPPAENKLPIAVEAGEKLPYERMRADG